MRDLKELEALNIVTNIFYGVIQVYVCAKYRTISEQYQ